MAAVAPGLRGAGDSKNNMRDVGGFGGGINYGGLSPEQVFELWITILINRGIVRDGEMDEESNNGECGNCETCFKEEREEICGFDDWENERFQCFAEMIWNF